MASFHASASVLPVGVMTGGAAGFSGSLRLSCGLAALFCGCAGANSPLLSFSCKSDSCFSSDAIRSFSAAVSASSVLRQLLSAAFSSTMRGEDDHRKSVSTCMNSSSICISRVVESCSACLSYSSASSLVRSSSTVKSSGLHLAISSDRKCWLTSLANTIGSRPARISSSIMRITPDASSFDIASANRNRKLLSLVPRTLRTSSSVTFSEYPRHMSRIDNASRMPPSAARAIIISALSVACAFAPSTASRRRPAICRAGIRPKSKRWQRLRIVAGSFCGSVVARMNTTYSGGSSSVLSSALNAEVDSI